MTDITIQPDAKPTSNLPSPAAHPQTPGVARPRMPERTPLDRFLPAKLARRVAWFFGFGDYAAEVAERIVGVYIIGDLTKQQIDEETRTGADYRTFLIDLSVAHTRSPIDGTKDLVTTNVALVALTASATLSIHVGDRDGIPFGGTGLGVGSGVECEPPEQTVLYVTNTAQPGATATILVSSGVRVSF
jgi:hypothetical protein